ncbi:hypothetical protein MJO28_001503 [Puccinia striiformis f. sp. tritici]|uniref:Uncharacterized protein n=1 Tax=Puccinia striiformis f. sp. tritici TaxID=168172 RepID=A0ACC0EVF1_9BASI|nr:hypothetical protein MJO28_001503 [Puccinia striiformis f. sp. tritici]
MPHVPLQSNDISSISHSSFCPVSTDIRAKLRREIFVLPRDIDEPVIVDTNCLSKEEKIILNWHRFFGHTSLQQICQIIQEKLVYNLPISIPKRDIKCSQGIAHQIKSIQVFEFKFDSIRIMPGPFFLEYSKKIKQLVPGPFGPRKSLHSASKGTRYPSGGQVPAQHVS